VSLFTFGGLGLGLKNPVLFTSLSFWHLDIYIDQKKLIRLAEDLTRGAGGRHELHILFLCRGGEKSERAWLLCIIKAQKHECRVTRYPQLKRSAAAF